MASSSPEFFQRYSNGTENSTSLKPLIEQLAIALRNKKPPDKFAEKTDIAEALRRIYWLIVKAEIDLDPLKQYFMSVNSKVPYQVGSIILKEDKTGQIPNVLLTYALYCWENYQDNDKHTKILMFLTKVIEEISARQSEEPTYHDNKDERKNKSLVM